MLRGSQDGNDLDTISTEQLPDLMKTYVIKVRDLHKQLHSTEMQLLEEKEINSYLEMIILFLRENKVISNSLWISAMKGNEENIATYRSSPRAMRRKSSFSSLTPPTSPLASDKDEKPVIPKLVVPNTGSPRTQLLSALNEDVVSIDGLSNLQIVDIIRDSLTRKSVRMTTLQNTIYDLRERINDEERKGLRIKSRMEKLGGVLGKMK